MRVLDKHGNSFEITREEMERIAFQMKHGGEEHEHIDDYHGRAYRNICEQARRYGIRHVEDTEGDVKKVLQVAIEEDDGDLVGEIIEWFISDHQSKMK